MNHAEFVELVERFGGSQWRADGCQKLSIPLNNVEAFAAALSCATPAGDVVDTRCPACLGSEFPGWKRGIRCATCNGSAHVEPGAASPVPMSGTGAQEVIDLGGTRLTEYDARTIRILLGKHHQMMITLPPNDVDRLKQLLAGAALAQEAIGTFNCPICGNGTPHHHSDFEQVQAMSEEQIDAELRALGIDPDKAAQKVKAVIDHCWAEYDRRLKNPIATPHHPVSAEAGKGDGNG